MISPFNQHDYSRSRCPRWQMTGPGGVSAPASYRWIPHLWYKATPTRRKSQLGPDGKKKAWWWQSFMLDTFCPEHFLAQRNRLWRFQGQMWGRRIVLKWYVSLKRFGAFNSTGRYWKNTVDLWRNVRRFEQETKKRYSTRKTAASEIRRKKRIWHTIKSIIWETGQQRLLGFQKDLKHVELMFFCLW